jgi:hypothetical protein
MQHLPSVRKESNVGSVSGDGLGVFGDGFSELLVLEEGIAFAAK